MLLRECKGKRDKCQCKITIRKLLVNKLFYNIYALHKLSEYNYIQAKIIY